MTMAGDYTMGILTRLGNRGNLTISTGDQTKENLDLLENKEDSDGFYRELRMRIFILLRSENFGNFTGESRMRIFNLLGSEKTLWGVAILLESKLSC